MDPDPVRHLDGDRRVESVYERTAEAGQLFSSAGGRPTPPTAQPAAPGRQIAGLAPLAIAGMAAAALIVLVAVLLVAGVI